jgi:tetratricopeptide (TPR) repeat protein
MKRPVMMLMAVSLLLCAAPYAMTASNTNAKKDKLEVARKAEEKGDLARIHNNYPAALDYYQIALHISRQNAVLYNKLGIVELQQSQRGAARKHFAQAARLEPQMISAINNLGAVDLLDKKYKSASNYFKQALAMDETVASTHLNLAEAWMGMGEIDRGMTEYARALELDADILSSTDEGVIAQVSTPEQRARIAYMVAKSYAKRGNMDGALDYLHRAKELRYPYLAKVYTDTDFTALWKDPRLEKIVKRP